MSNKKLPKSKSSSGSATAVNSQSDFVPLNKNTRFISLMTYAVESDILKVLDQRREFLSGCRYILHDKDVWDVDGVNHKIGDPKEAHYHICLVLVRARRLSDVIGWFKCCVDSKGYPANTMAEAVTSLSSLEEYFTHSDSASVAKGKHQYDVVDLKILDGIPSAFDFRTSYDKTGGMSRDEKSEEANALLVDDILSGVSFREMARRYGRDYMKNYKVYREYCSCILLEENGGDLDEALSLMGDPILKAQRDRERSARDEGRCVGVRDTLLSVIAYLDNRVKKGETYLSSTVDVLRTALKEGGFYV